MTTIAGFSRSTRPVISVSVSSAFLRRITVPRSAKTTRFSAIKLLVEEGELLHVGDELQRRFRKRRQVEALLPQPRLVEEHLEREDRLARARLSGDHVDRAHRQPAAEDAIEGRAARREDSRRGRTAVNSASSARQTSPWSRSSGICSSRLMTTAPGQLDEQPPDLRDQHAERARRARPVVLDQARRQRVAVLEVLATTTSVDELRALRRRALRRATHDRGRRRRCRALRRACPRRARTAWRRRRRCPCRRPRRRSSSAPFLGRTRVNPPAGAPPARRRPRRGAPCRPAWSGASETRRPALAARSPSAASAVSASAGVSAAVRAERPQLADERVSVLAGHRDVAQEHLRPELLGRRPWPPRTIRPPDAWPPSLEHLGHGLARRGSSSTTRTRRSFIGAVARTTPGRPAVPSAPSAACPVVGGLVAGPA